DPPLELLEREVPVVGGVAPAELVEIDAVHDFHPVARDGHCAINSCTAARRSAGSTVWPVVGRPGAPHRTNGTGPAAVRFLSRPVAKITASTSVPSSWVGSPAASSISWTCARNSSAPDSRSSA